jgi:hypothetical protein
MHERDQVNQFRNLRFIRPGRLALASVGIEAAGVAATLISKDPDYYQAFAPLVAFGNAGLAAEDAAFNPRPRYLFGFFRKPEGL